MCESPKWTPILLMIDVKGSFFDKVIKYWLRLIEASMEALLFFKFFLRDSTFQNTINNSFESCNQNTHEM